MGGMPAGRDRGGRSAASPGPSYGQLTKPAGQPTVIPFLWSLGFGNGHAAGPTSTLFFTAGIAGQFHGLFGSLQVAGRGG